MSDDPSDITEERVVRHDPSPLVMRKKRTRKEDGRELIYYDFVRPEPAREPKGQLGG
jgi:hypothetical protein